MRTASVFSPRSARNAVHRPGHRAHRVHQEPEPLDPLRVARDDRAADQVGVPADVLRHAVHDGVGAERERALQRGRGERVVHHDARARARARRLATAAMSTIFSSGFDGVSTHTSLVVGRIASRSAVDVRQVDGGGREAPVGQDLREQPVRPAVDVVRQHDVIAGPQREQQRGLRAEPAREREPVRAPLERGERLLERLARRVPAAAVVPDLRPADLVLRVRRGLVDRDVHGPVERLGVLARVDRARLEAQAVYRISGGSFHPRSSSSSIEPRPSRARRHSMALRFASCPGANSPRTSAWHSGSPHAQ